MKKEMKREVEDALEILNGLISNYNDFFINESKPIPDEIKDTYLNVAKAFMNDLKEEDLKKYQKSSSYEDLVSKYNTLKSNVSEAESRIKEHNDKVIMLDKENKIKDMGEISSDASIKDDIITVPSEELLLVSSADDKLKYVTDKIKYVTSLESTLEEEILILTYTNKDSKSYMNALKDYPNVGVMPINKFIYSLSDIKTTEVSLNKVIDEELSNNLKDDNYTRNLVLYLLHYHQNTYSSLAFSDKNSYNDYLDSLNLKTLKGETVSSPAILNITDFLTENKVNYKIKNILEDNEIFNVISLDNDIDIIYFELDEKGERPVFFKDSYIETVDKIRNDYENSHTKLIECYAYEKKNGSIINNLYTKLYDAGVKFALEESHTLLDLLEKQNPNLIPSLKETMLITIKALIEENKPLEEFNKTLSERKFVELLKPIYDKYNISSDFSNETYKIIDNLKDNLNYKFIILDNFEEITTSKFKLIQKIKNITGANLLFLGDDWQSIYLNSGTNPKYIKNIKKYYPDIKISLLPYKPINFRLYEIAKKVISMTNNYYDKNVEVSDSFSSIGIIRVKNKDDIKDKLINIVKSLPGSITIAGRYSGDNVDVPNTKFILINDTKIYNSDYTFIINTEKGLCGYPNELINNVILNKIIEIEPAIYNEYRTLANIIRNTNKRVYLVVTEENTSKVFRDIIDTYKDDILAGKNECPICGSSLIIKPSGDKEELECSNEKCSYHSDINEN
ncbi:MAG: hypothetical protein DBY43_03200 [Clostridiaceae bacterium]|nr:MAG: hypothetical protein DBY43_03200 [Clostridiaceae bacterium]